MVKLEICSSQSCPSPWGEGWHINLSVHSGAICPNPPQRTSLGSLRWPLPPGSVGLSFDLSLALVSLDLSQLCHHLVQLPREVGGEVPQWTAAG